MSIEHNTLAGTQLHDAFGFVATSDPGAAGAGLYWLNTASNPYLLFKRDAANANWIPVGASGGSGSVPPWVANSPDNPPTSPTAWDDEFTSSATLPGGAGAKWTWYNQRTATAAIVGGGNCVDLGIPQQNNLTGLLNTTSVPGSGSWAFTAKITMNTQIGQTSYYSGIFVQDAAGKNVLLALAFEGAQPLVKGYHCSTATSFTQVYSNICCPCGSHLYLSLQSDGTKLYFYYSVDAKTYYQIYNETLNSYLSASTWKVGIAGFTSNATFGFDLHSQWFRRTA